MDYPIILIPGLLATIGDDIIPGSGKLRFGLAKPIYDPLLRSFISMGYREGRDFFIAFYNWRNKNKISSEKYLLPVIERAKKVSGKDKVNIICHSMGGLVARSYIQSDIYKKDVDKLIMIATPNAGAVKAYHFWEGGEIPFERVENNVFLRLLWQGYVWLLKNLEGMEDDISGIRNMFPSVGELVPSYNYGNYLYKNTHNNYYQFIPIRHMIIKNDFLNDLNRKPYQMVRRGVKVYHIVGNGYNTERYICVEDIGENSIRWLDGKPKFSVETKYGDGTVTVRSATSVYGKGIYLNEDHNGILRTCGKDIAKILGRRINNSRQIVRRRYDNIPHNKYSMIIARDVNDIYIRNRGKKVSVKEILKKQREYKNKIIILQVFLGCYWIMYNSKYFENGQIEVLPHKNTNSKICILDANDRGANVKNSELIIRKPFITKI